VIPIHACNYPIALCHDFPLLFACSISALTSFPPDHTPIVSTCVRFHHSFLSHPSHCTQPKRYRAQSGSCFYSIYVFSSLLLFFLCSPFFPSCFPPSPPPYPLYPTATLIIEIAQSPNPIPPSTSKNRRTLYMSLCSNASLPIDVIC